MSRKLISQCAVVVLLGVSLMGCASFAQSPTNVAANVGAAVKDTQTVANGAVTIAVDLANAALALTKPITSIIGLAGTF